MTGAARKLPTGVAMAAVAILSICTASACTTSVPPSVPAPRSEPTTQKPAPPPPVPAPESVHANELGEVPVLMYHRITDQPRSVYDRTPSEFRAELERLAAQKYVPVTATDYATGRINIPAGTHPVVLTFDDGSRTQFTLDKFGKPAANTAVGILLDVASQHPGFRPVATFYVFRPPFEEPAGRVALPWLHRHGFEIGNHTMDHPNLGRVSAAETQHQLAGMRRIITDTVGEAEVRSLALPLGVSPDQEHLAQDGSSGGVTYHHDSVFLVGSNPAPSPWSAEFDRRAIPRIRSQNATGPDARYGSTVWLDKLAAEPDRRYTSDGRADRISVPSGRPEKPAPSAENRIHRY